MGSSKGSRTDLDLAKTCVQLLGCELQGGESVPSRCLMVADCMQIKHAIDQAYRDLSKR